MLTMIKHLAVVVTVSASLGYGQTSTSATTPNSVSVTVSRTLNIQADQVVFSVTADASLDVTRDDILNAVQGAGITLANLSGVSGGSAYDPGTQQSSTTVDWQFTLAVPLSSMKSTAALLGAVQKNNSQKNNGINISFLVQGTQISRQALQAQNCSLVDLIADARAKALNIASAAGKSVGTLLAVSGATSAADYNGGVGYSFSYPACTLSAKFQLTGF
jgi:hypothetical protein